ncbi:hypothetical protein J6590_036022 [Homalodisca vitripennis]|nr:hypothetical protein J6590_036022 [Homalodisca vitripennis]
MTSGSSKPPVAAQPRRARFCSEGRLRRSGNTHPLRYCNLESTIRDSLFATRVVGQVTRAKEHALNWSFKHNLRGRTSKTAVKTENIPQLRRMALHPSNKPVSPDLLPIV